MDSLRHWSNLCGSARAFSKPIHQCARRADRRAFGGSEETGEHPPHHQRKKRQRFPNALERGELRFQVKGRPRRPELRSALATG